MTRKSRSERTDAVESFIALAASTLSEEGRPQPGDEALIERRATAAMQKVTGAAAPSAPLSRVRLAPSSRPLRPFVYGLAFAAALAALGVAAAAVYSARQTQTGGEPKQAASPTEVVRTPAPVVPSPSATPSSAVPTIAVDQLPSAAIDNGAKPAALAGSQLSASQLFERANEVRRSGRLSEAVTLYLELERRFPDAPESAIAQVTAGRTLQDTHRPAEALAQFDGYLRHGGPLREEALVGRAACLEALGRSDEERQAWTELLSEFPQSLSVGRARGRLNALSPR